MLCFYQEEKVGILATMGPTLNTEEDVVKAIQLGVENFRLALSSRDRDLVSYINNIKKAHDKTRKNCDVLLDFPASRPRTCKMDPILFQANDCVDFVSDKKSSDEGIVLSNFETYIPKLNVNDRLLFRDGKIKFKIKSIKDNVVSAICLLASADLRTNCSCVFPDTKLEYEPILDLDCEALLRLKEANLEPDWFALSFATSKDQIMKMKGLAQEYFPNKRIKIMSKIENQMGIDNIHDIMNDSDGIMIGRGDLALHINPVHLPKIQEFLVSKAKEYKKVCVIATEFLEVYANTGIINRAELSDIALGTRQKPTALMLSMESANSKYPFECIKLMSDVIKDNI